MQWLRELPVPEVVLLLSRLCGLAPYRSSSRDHTGPSPGWRRYSLGLLVVAGCSAPLALLQEDTERPWLLGRVLLLAKILDTAGAWLLCLGVAARQHAGVGALLSRVQPRMAAPIALPCALALACNFAYAACEQRGTTHLLQVAGNVLLSVIFNTEAFLASLLLESVRADLQVCNRRIADSSGAGALALGELQALRRLHRAALRMLRQVTAAAQVPVAVVFFSYLLYIIIQLYRLSFDSAEWLGPTPVGIAGSILGALSLLVTGERIRREGEKTSQLLADWLLWEECDQTAETALRKFLEQVDRENYSVNLCCFLTLSCEKIPMMLAGVCSWYLLLLQLHPALIETRR